MQFKLNSNTNVRIVQILRRKHIPRYDVRMSESTGLQSSSDSQLPVLVGGMRSGLCLWSRVSDPVSADIEWMAAALC